jgi:hypothetical protein
MKAFVGNGINKSRVVVSLCDYSGTWPRPWHEAGHTVLCYDLKHGDDCTTLFAVEVIEDARAASQCDDATIVCVLAAPVCTDFSVSGAQYWPTKDADGTTARSLALVDACVALAQKLSPDCWALENPVGRLRKLRPSLGTPVWFNPCDFAGLVAQPEKQEAEWGLSEYMTSNRYTKKTGLWGTFKAMTNSPLEPVRACAQGSWSGLLGGKSEHTKELRSMTPLGMARAFYAANQHI